MDLLLTVVLVGLLSGGAGARVGVHWPDCDSPDAEEAALVAQDHINAQHAHGYKYALNRIEDIKVYTKPDGNSTYVLEMDLLETDCHVLDPTPVANCSVRPKVLTAIEGDCDVVLKKVGGILMVTNFYCKTEESTEDFCLGCHSLLPLNDTTALNLVRASLRTFNNRTGNETFLLLEVGRMTSQVVSGGPAYMAEYVVIEGHCTEDFCVPVNDINAARGLCTARGSHIQHTVDCKMFPPSVPSVDANGTTVVVAKHNLTHRQSLRHHRLPSLLGPELNNSLSTESAESEEIVTDYFPKVPAADPGVPATDPGVPAADPGVPAADPGVPAADPGVPAADPGVRAGNSGVPAADPGPAVSDSSSAAEDSQSAEVPVILLKRDLSAALEATLVDAPVTLSEPVSIKPLCPGRVRYF